MKENKQNQVLALIGFSLLALAGEGSPGMDGVIAAALSAAGMSSESQPPVPPGERAGVDEYCHGVRQLADYLHVSTPTAQKYINSGVLDPAIRKVGRKYSFNKSKVDEIFKVK